MPLQINYEKCRLTVQLSGDIDHHSAAALRGQIDQAITKLRPPKLILDFSDVTFMDSSAVGLVMGRFRTLTEYGGEMEVVNLSPLALRMMEMANLQSLAVLRLKENEKEKESNLA